MASCTASLRIKPSIKVRKCERSGPMADVRTRLKYTRMTRLILASACSGSFVSENKVCNVMGWPTWTKVWRPCTNVEINRRSLPPAPQFSENKTLNTLASLSGARPTSTDTGTNCRSPASSKISGVICWINALSLAECRRLLRVRTNNPS